MPATARHVFVTGRVQGVAFRWYAQERALELDVCGWVRNLADGRVEAWIEGEAAAVKAMARWFGEGPSHASVTDVEIHEKDAKGLRDFGIRPTSM